MKAIQKIRPSMLQAIVAGVAATILVFAGCQAMADEAEVPISHPLPETAIEVEVEEDHGFLDYLKDKFNEIKAEYNRLTTPEAAAEESEVDAEESEATAEDSPSS